MNLQVPFILMHSQILTHVLLCSEQYWLLRRDDVICNIFRVQEYKRRKSTRLHFSYFVLLTIINKMCYFDAAKPFCVAVKHTCGYQTLCDVTKGTTFTFVTLAITIYYNLLQPPSWKSHRFCGRSYRVFLQQVVNHAKPPHWNLEWKKRVKKKEPDP